MADLSLVTVAEFKARYPVFADADATLIGLLLDEARGSVNTSWIEADQKPALLAYTAYLLANEIAAQSGTISLGGVGGGTTQVTGAVEEIWVGDVKAKFATTNSSSSNSGGTSTGPAGGITLSSAASLYLGRYRQLYRRSFPSVMVV